METERNIGAKRSRVRMPDETGIRKRIVGVLSEPGQEPLPEEIALIESLLPFADRRPTAAKVGRVIGECVFRLGWQEYHGFEILTELLTDLFTRGFAKGEAQRSAMNVYFEGTARQLH